MTEPVTIGNATLYCGDALTVLQSLESESVQCVVTSPPYFGLRDYGHDGQIGLEETPQEYVAALVAVFREVRRVLRDDGTVWVNLGDSYAANRSYQVSDGKHQSHDFGGSNAAKVPDGLKPKDLLGIPWRVAFALQDDGWYLRQDIIWHKPNPMPESVRDRCTKAHEYVFLLSKSARYYYDADAIKETGTGRTPGNTKATKAGRESDDKYRTSANLHHIEAAESRNKRSVWTITTRPYSGAHFATFPPELPQTCIMAGTKPGDVVIDPFSGAGTTGVVALDLDRRFIGIEISEAYMSDLIVPRIDNAQRQGRLAI